MRMFGNKIGVFTVLVFMRVFKRGIWLNNLVKKLILNAYRHLFSAYIGVGR